jgi:hypothetical protein
VVLAYERGTLTTDTVSYVLLACVWTKLEYWFDACTTVNGACPELHSITFKLVHMHCCTVTH